MTQGCRICEQPATHTLGSYAFCEKHHHTATRQRGSLWRADAISLLILVAFVALVFVFDAVADPRFDRGTLTVVGIVLALVPAAIWLAFFYRRDRLEPEPKGMVLGVFVLGALVAAAIGIPLVGDVFDVDSWIGQSFVTQLLGGILVIGFTQEFLKYATVRFSVYQSREFDEWTDGILYATAAGLGFATMLNIDFIVSSGGADLGLGAVGVALTALAHASIAGVTGYFLGRDRLEVRPIWWVPLGVAIAAVLNGIFFYLRAAITQGVVGGIPTSLYGLALAIVLALVITFLLARTVQREVSGALRRTQPVQGE